uniref:Uncharacterized protein n=1 Tax=Arundo donax TaxID=35708 RepID=A0A0A9EJP7_ARUDO
MQQSVDCHGLMIISILSPSCRASVHVI